MMVIRHGRVSFSLLLLVFGASLAGAQSISTIVATHLRGGTGDRYELLGPQKQRYFEAWSDVRLYAPWVALGVRVEHSRPPEFGESVSGITKFFADASYKNFNVRAGDIYTLFGNGLTLNLIENRELAFDTGLRGVNARYSSPSFNVSALAGSMSFNDFVTLGRSQPLIAEYDVYGASASANPFRMLTLGATFVRSERSMPAVASSPGATVISDMPSVSASVRLPWADLTFERSWRTQGSTQRGPAINGFATYMAFSHSGNGYGITVEYKDYALEPLDPATRTAAGRSTEVPAFVLAPPGAKEHTFILPGRFPHNVDYGDETGLQAEVVLLPRDDLSITVNGSLSSQRYAWSLDLPTFSILRLEEGIPWLTSLADGRSPRGELYIESEYTGESFSNRARLALHYLTETDYFLYNPALTKRRHVFTIPADILWEITGDIAGGIQAEIQWVDDTSLLLKPSHMNQVVSVSLTGFSWLTGSLRHEWSTGRDDPSGRTSWTVFEGSARIDGAHLVTVSYGAERGGQVCSGGICRIIEPFSGLRILLTSNF